MARSTHPRPPAHLLETEARLWADVQSTYAVDDAAGLHMLTTACECAQRARMARETVDSEGMVSPSGKPHPLLSVERDSRRLFLSAIAALGLDIELGGNVGRPTEGERKLRRIA